MREPLPRPLASSSRCDILNSFHPKQIACNVASQVILILWDTYANNAARSEGKGENIVVIITDSSALFITINYFGLSKAQLLLNLIRKKEIIQKINLRFCAFLFNLKLFRSPFGFREKFRDENGILFFFFLYFLAITKKKRDEKQQRRYKRVLIFNTLSK